MSDRMELSRFIWYCDQIGEELGEHVDHARPTIGSSGAEFQSDEQGESTDIQEYEDDQIRILRGHGSFEVTRKDNQNPVIWVTNGDLVRRHGEWTKLTSHVLELWEEHIDQPDHLVQMSADMVAQMLDLN